MTNGLLLHLFPPAWHAHLGTRASPIPRSSGPSSPWPLTSGHPHFLAAITCSSGQQSPRSGGQYREQQEFWKPHFNGYHLTSSSCPSNYLHGPHEADSLVTHVESWNRQSLYTGTSLKSYTWLLGPEEWDVSGGSVQSFFLKLHSYFSITNIQLCIWKFRRKIIHDPTTLLQSLLML